MPARTDHTASWFQSRPPNCPTNCWRCSAERTTPVRMPAACLTRTTAGGKASCNSWTTCSSKAPSSGRDGESVLPELVGSALALQVVDARFDQHPVPFPFDQGLLHELNQPLGLRGVVTV